MIAPVGADTTSVVEIKKFNGKISILNGYIQGGVSVTPENPALNILLWNIHFYHVMNPSWFVNSKSNFKGAFLGLSTQCFQSGNPECGQILSKEDKLIGVTNEQSFVLDMVAQDRAAIPIKYTGRAPNASTIFISRVSVGNMATAFRFSK